MSFSIHEDDHEHEPASPRTLDDSQPPADPKDPAAAPQDARKRLHNIRTQPKTRAKRRKRITAIDDPDDATRVENLLNRETRWITFLYHSTHEESSVLAKVFGEACSASDYRYGHDKIGDLVKNFKHFTLDNVERHIERLILDQEELIEYDGSMAKNFFSRMYSVESFYACWRYMDGVLDVEGSSDLGKYFCKTLYFNICCEVLAWMQVKHDPEKESYARKQLLAFWDNLPTVPQFGKVDRAQFKEIFARVKGQKKAKKIPDTSSLVRFRSLGSPPPPVAVEPPADAGADDAAVAAAAGAAGADASDDGGEEGSPGAAAGAAAGAPGGGRALAGALGKAAAAGKAGAVGGKAGGKAGARRGGGGAKG